MTFNKCTYVCSFIHLSMSWLCPWRRSERSDTPAAVSPKHHSLLKGRELLGEMPKSKAGAGEVQDKTGVFYDI